MSEFPITFGPFQLLHPLGRGGMGEVFVARAAWPEHPIGALKRMRADLMHVQPHVDRFHREAGIVSQLIHLNIVQAYRAGIVGGQACVYSELVLGKDIGRIGDRLRSASLGGPIAVAVRVLLDCLFGLSYVHNARAKDGKLLGLVHRDITPGNVLLGYDGVARIADVGLARAMYGDDDDLTSTGELLGTPHFIAPELIQGARATPAADLYGLGAVMYSVLTGHPPYRGSPLEVLFAAIEGNIEPISELRPDLPAWLANVLHRMLERDPRRRPRSAMDLAIEVLHFARRSRVLPSRAAVGGWLGRFFPIEQGQDLDHAAFYGAVTHAEEAHAYGEGQSRTQKGTSPCSLVPAPSHSSSSPERSSLCRSRSPSPEKHPKIPNPSRSSRSPSMSSKTPLSPLIRSARSKLRSCSTPRAAWTA